MRAGFWAGIAILTLAACQVQKSSVLGAEKSHTAIEIRYLDPSERYPRGHFEISGHALGGELEVCSLVSGITGGEEHAGLVRARLSDGRPAPGVLLVRDQENSGLIFEPRFGLQQGEWYEAVFSPSGEAPPATLTFRTALASEPKKTEVCAIYPSADELPENLLRFYIQFSGPMRRGQALEHVHLYRDDTQEVEGVFLDLTPELWNADASRLTLLLDPARIKRGMPALAKRGPALQRGVSYSLRVDPAWEDSSGCELIGGHEKRFKVVAPDRRSPDPSGWRLSSPREDSLDSLRVEFDEPIDHALAERMLTVRQFDGSPLLGRGKVGAGECSWEWKPSNPWRPGGYVLVLDPLLEDRAGNGLARLFDQALTRESDGGEAVRVQLPFSTSDQ